MMKLITISITCLLLLCSLSCSHPTVSSKRLVERDGVKFLIQKDGTSDKPYTGRVADYFPNGELREMKNYKGGVKHGPYEYYYNSGQLTMKGTFKDAVADGTLESYYPNGQLARKTIFRDGDRHRSVEEYFDNGQLKRNGVYEFDNYFQRQGLHQSYYRNGQLREKGTYKNNKRHGFHESYFPNGQLIEKRIYKEGVKSDGEPGLGPA